MNENARKVKAVIFDLDGTLLNSREERVHAWSHAFRKYGIKVPDDELRPLIGLPGAAIVSLYSGDPESIEAEEERYFSDLLPEISYFSDAEPTIKELEDSGIRVSIVTSSRKALLDQMHLPTQTVVCIDDVSQGKPSTEPYELASKLLNADPGEILVVGDAENDMIPCSKTGSVCVFFRDGRDIVSEYAHYYIDRIGEVPDLIRKINAMKVQ